MTTFGVRAGGSGGPKGVRVSWAYDTEFVPIAGEHGGGRWVGLAGPAEPIGAVIDRRGTASPAQGVGAPSSGARR